MIDRRALLLGVGGTLVAPCADATEWTPIDPAEAGFPADLGTRIDQFAGGKNIHGVIVVRHGRIVVERYYAGEDQVRDSEGRMHVERVAFSPRHSHDLRSVTKSIIGLLYGIALRDGKVPPLDAPLLAQFPQYDDLPDMAQRRGWTIRHAITMTLGMDWNEEISYDDPRNGQTAMERSPDRARYALEQPIVAVAGERWIYSAGATTLIGKIIEHGVGASIHDYARRVLFDPLGLGPTEWRSVRAGEPIFASGLAMRPRDLARVGQLLLDGGSVGERQVVPADWLEASFTPAVRIDDRRHYGYHWYVGNTVRGRDLRWIGAFGNGGQRLFALPEPAIVVVVTAGSYNQRAASNDLVGDVLEGIR